METYPVGNGAIQISMSADISTISLAASRALVVDLNSSDPGKPVGHSADATGDISKTGIGTAAALRGLRLSIFTRIDVLGSSLEERKKEYDRATGYYSLSGGTNGDTNFNTPDKSANADYSTMILHQLIDLV
jgi:hypothetical protein